MIRNIIFSVTIILFAFQSVAQESQQISGTVTDKKTGEPVAYANVGIEGTYYGAATNFEGYFEFKFPSDQSSGTLFASAVGYQGFRIQITEISSNNLKIEIEPTAYDIGVVDVSANSLVLFKVIKDAIDAIPDNYPQKPLEMTAYYKNETAVNDETPRVDEAVVGISDASGYKREEPLKEQKNRNYMFVENRKNYDSKTLADGMNVMDNLLNCDIVRTRRNILDKPFLKDYDLISDPAITYQGESVWIINYTLNNPTFDRTGIYNVTSYQGKIYISKANNAILKNELWVRAKNPSIHGWSIASTGSEKDAQISAEYEIITTYNKGNNGYLPAFIKSVSRKTTKDSATGAGKTIATESYLLPTATNLTNPTMLRSRSYYSDLPYNKNFWDNFDIVIE